MDSNLFSEVKWQFHYLLYSLALNENFFARLLCVSTRYHFCGVLNDVGNHWLWKFERSTIDRREQQMLQSMRFLLVRKTANCKCIGSCYFISLPVWNGFSVDYNLHACFTLFLFELQWQKRWRWIIICSVDQAEYIPVITDGKTFYWNLSIWQSVFRSFKIIEIIWNNAWITSWSKDQRAKWIETFILLVKTNRWRLTRSLVSDSDLTRSRSWLDKWIYSHWYYILTDSF